jgi:hypothetical protein
VGENSECPPTVVQLQWPKDITNNVKSNSSPNRIITNSDLKMVGLLIIFLVMEEIVCDLTEANIALLSNNTPTVSWVTCLASTAFHCCGKLGGGTCPLPQKTALLPANTTTHQGKREYHNRHTITLIWQCTIMAFQIEQ